MRTDGEPCSACAPRWRVFDETVAIPEPTSANVVGTPLPVEGVLGAIGNTPLLRLRRYLSRPDVDLWAKLEQANPAGSSKDRPAARILTDALEDGSLLPGATVVESSSGNMGVGLAQACRFLGLKLICVVDHRAQPSKIRTMRAFGAEVRVVTSPDPVHADLLIARLALVEEIVESTPGTFRPDQYANRANPAAHDDGTMREIDEALDGDVDYLFVAVSTGGTLRGCSDYLSANRRATTLIAVDAAGSVLFGGKRGERLLPGLGAGVETVHSLKSSPDQLIRVSDLDCVVGCRRLVEREAAFAGPSSGGVAFAVESICEQLESGARCVAIFPDGGSSYLETVYDDEWVDRELGCDSARLEQLVDGYPSADPLHPD